MMSRAFTNVTSFVGKHKVAVAAAVGATALAAAGYKYLTREKVWVEGNCIKFTKRTPFCREEGFICFKTPEKATAAHKVFEEGNVLGGFSWIKDAAEAQRKCPSFEWNAGVMTDAEAQKFMDETFAEIQKFQRDMHEEQDRIMKEAFGKCGHQGK